MGGRVLAAALAMSTVVLASPGWAGGFGGFHGGGFHGGGGFRPPTSRPAMGSRGFGGGAFHGGGSWGGGRSMPPVAGVIHERPGARPYYSAYGHSNTGYGLGGGSRYGFGGYAPRAGGLRYGGYASGGFGHVATGFRREGVGRYGRERFGGGWERGRFAGGRRFGIYGFGRGYGGYGGGYYGGGGGFYDGAGGFDGAGTYGSAGTYGGGGTYGAPGTYGSLGTQAGYGGAYLSEPPLAATRTEAPLAPSPYGPDGGYYTPSQTRFGPHVLTVDRASRAGCDCGSRPSAYPVIYRYGVGTAY